MAGPRFPSDGYAARVVDRQLDVLLEQLPAVLLDGPKGVGKTWTAVRRAATARRLDEPAQREVAEADVQAALAGPRPVLLDEWQRVPAVWDAVKRHVDADLSPGQFLLTGSAASRAGTHSGAARIAAVRMRPLTLPERGVTDPTVSLAALLNGHTDIVGTSTMALADYTDEVVRSGFPGLSGLTGWPLQTQLDGYVDLIVDHEMADAGLRVRRPATLLAWLRAYAAATASPTSFERIRDAATSGSGSPPAQSTTYPYIDTLTDLRVLDPVPAWTPSLNPLSRLTQAPKHHLADPALAARLLGQTPASLLDGDTGPVDRPREGSLLGDLFESLATLCVRVFAQACRARVSHLRTRGGEQEIDLIVERDDGCVLAVEVKLSDTVRDRDVRHLAWLRDRIGDRLIGRVVLSPGPQAYRRRDGVAVVPLALLGP